jgi:hypothetical protein
MRSANTVRKTIFGLLLACGPIEDKKTFPLSDAVYPDGGVDTSSDCREVCQTILQHEGYSSFSTIKGCSFVTTDAGTPGVYCDFTVPSEGRIPPGRVAWSRRLRSSHPVGLLFAAAAQLELAAVAAFRGLARELVAHGAPARLVRGARRAAGDEVRHGAVMTRLARRYGAAPARPTVAQPPLRTLQALALDNAIEGCVRETHGALVAGWQARTAADPEVRRSLRTVAADELRHAELSWQIAGWAEAQLPAAARRRIERARRSAGRAMLEREVRTHSSWVELAGIPSPDQERALIAALRETLWT